MMMMMDDIRHKVVSNCRRRSYNRIAVGR